MKSRDKNVVWLLSIITIILIFLFAVRKEFIHATDSGFLIKTGEYIYQNLKIPDRDFFSHTFNGHPWLLDRWAPCLFFFLLYHFLGISGAILVKAGIVAAGFLVLMVMLLQEKRDPLIIFAALILGAYVSRGRFLLRPQVISMLIFAFQIYLTEQYLRNRGDRRTLIKLLILLVVWANLHSEWAYGIIYLFSLCFTEIGNGIYQSCRVKTAGENETKESLPLLYLLLAGIGLSVFTVQLANPNGSAVLLLPFRMAQNRFWDQAIFELMPVFPYPDFYVYCGVLFLGLILSYRKVEPRDLALFLVFGVMVALHRRVIHAFVLLTIPMMVRSWDQTLAEFRERVGKPGGILSSAGMFGRLGLPAGVSLLILFGIINQPGKVFGLGFHKNSYPADIFNCIQEKKLSGNYFNYADWGGAMILFLYPQVRVFIDGRYQDLYDDEFYRNTYLHIVSGFPDWENQIEIHGVEYILINSIRSPRLKENLENNRRWKLICTGDNAWLYGKMKSGSEGPGIPGTFPGG